MRMCSELVVLTNLTTAAKRKKQEKDDLHSIAILFHTQRNVKVLQFEVLYWQKSLDVWLNHFPSVKIQRMEKMEHRLECFSKVYIQT